MAIQSLYPSSRPTLNLHFAKVKALDPRITFTRTTTAAYYNANGVLETAAAGEARFDHDPITGESLGLLVEEQRTNLVLRSEEFDNAYWTKTRSSITANTIVAPDGTLTGDKLVEDTTETKTHQISRSISWTSGTTYTRSLYVKAAERTGFRFQFPSGAFGSAINAYFDLATGTVTSVGSLGTAAITLVGNDWYRCTLTATATATASASEISCGLTISPGTPTYTGDGFSGVFLWGAQLEAGAFATSYIATTSATVTRNADVASMTGTNFSSWYRADEGTLYAEAAVTLPASGGNQFIFRTSANEFGNAVALNIINQGNLSLSTSSGGVFDGIATSVVILTANVFAKAAGAYATNNLGLSLNGATVVADTSATIPTTPNRLDIGSDHVGSNRIKAGHIRKLAYYPERLTDAELQQLTK